MHYPIFVNRNQTELKMKKNLLLIALIAIISVMGHAQLVYDSLHGRFKGKTMEELVAVDKEAIEEDEKSTGEEVDPSYLELTTYLIEKAYSAPESAYQNHPNAEAFAMPYYHECVRMKTEVGP